MTCQIYLNSTNVRSSQSNESCFCAHARSIWANCSSQWNEKMEQSIIKLELLLLKVSRELATLK